MNENVSRKTQVHNTVLVILTIAVTGAVIESITLKWEFWVPPLIIAGLVASWVLHLMQYKQESFRENYYLVFSMMVAFYHGVHTTSFFDVFVISALLMVMVTLLKRPQYLKILLAEFLALMLLQIILAVKEGSTSFDSLTISRILLHVVAEICIYKALSAIVRHSIKDEEDLEKKNIERQNDKTDMEDFLSNISHELRTPVNVINGMSTLILKKEKREDVASIMDAGLRLSHQIGDIQDYSEIQREDVRLEEDRYMITSLVNDIVALVEGTIDTGGKEFVIDLDPNVPNVMKGDAVKIGKIIRHLLSNAFKFTRRGGVCLTISTIRREYGANLIIDVTDTGIGMTPEETEKISRGIFQSNRKKNRSTGGIGLGLPIVYGFVRSMSGFVSVESAKKIGTTVRVSIAQEIIDPSPCLAIDRNRFLNVIFHMDPSDCASLRVWEFYRTMAADLAAGLRINMYFSQGIKKLDALMDRGDITHVFVSPRQYELYKDRFENLPADVPVVIMKKPFYSYPAVRVLNGRDDLRASVVSDRRPHLDGLCALVVDDEPMNLIVATGLFGEYNMRIDTAKSGREAIEKYMSNEYDVVFMDHMMPEMDGVEAAKKIAEIASQQGRSAKIIALTANVVSGAREMFAREGFAGFIGKPIEIGEFERVMNRVFPGGTGA